MTTVTNGTDALFGHDLSPLDRCFAQRAQGRTPSAELEAAIQSAARDARERSISPESLLVQLKLVAEEAGVYPSIGIDEGTNALREWLVSACVTAYFKGE